jgi:hypothetical protein
VSEQTPPDQHPAELSIIQSAQAFVDGWLHDTRRRPFAAVVEAAAARWGADHPFAEQQRIAFIRVAKAIRAGAGHATARPGPLLKIVRSVFRSDDDRSHQGDA